MSLPSMPYGLRVIYVVSLFPCWSETFIVREIKALIERGVDVRIVSLKHPVEALVQSDAAALASRVIYPPKGWALVRQCLAEAVSNPTATGSELVGLWRGLRGRPLALAKSWVVWVRTLGLLATLRRLQPRHLHAHWATYPSTAAFWVSGRTRIPFSFTAHAHDIFLEDHLLLPKLKAAAFGVTISDFNRRYLAEHISPLATSRVRVIHCGVEPGDYAFRPRGRQPGLVLSVGRLDTIKGFPCLIEACAILAHRGVAFECAIIGDGPLRESLEQRISELGLQHRVRLLGACKQEQVREHLYAASVFALASVVTAQGDRDGIPVALMEAMACGTPVVSTTVSGIPELVTHGYNGLLAEPGDARGLASCIEQMLASPENACKMAERARRTIEADFDVAVEAGKLVEGFA